MTFLQELLIALVQGITEFLPISSSGHLILIPKLTDFPDQGPLIDVAVQGHSSRQLDLYITTTKLLCLVVTAKTNKFYIPGETNLVERLRKRAFDCGTYALLTYIFNKLKN